MIFALIFLQGFKWEARVRWYYWMNELFLGLLRLILLVQITLEVISERGKAAGSQGSQQLHLSKTEENKSPCEKHRILCVCVCFATL